MASLHLQMRARYFVITSKSTWTSIVAVMARVYGFATENIFVIDIEEKQSSPLAALARAGCSFSDKLSDSQKDAKVDKNEMAEKGQGTNEN